jgi:hypothetical protein
MTQTIILNQLGLMYSGDRRALELAELFQSVPVTLGRRKRLFSNVLPPDKLSSMLLPIDGEWQLWVLDEQRRRAGFAIWVRLLLSNFLVHSSVLIRTYSSLIWATTTTLIYPTP